jgi:hypothetical protein
MERDPAPTGPSINVIIGREGGARSEEHENIRFPRLGEFTFYRSLGLWS